MLRILPIFPRQKQSWFLFRPIKVSTPTNTVPGPASAISTTSHFTACRHKQAPCARPTLERHKIQTGQDALSEKKADMICRSSGYGGRRQGGGCIAFGIPIRVRPCFFTPFFCIDVFSLIFGKFYILVFVWFVIRHGPEGHHV